MKTAECPNCEQILKYSMTMKKIGGTFMCSKCYKERRLAKRRKLWEQCKADGTIGLSPQEKHEICLKRDGDKPKNLKIRGVKKTIRQRKGRIKNLGLYLTLDEKRLLLKKYMKEGLSFEDAKVKVNERVKDMQDLTIKLREKKKSEAEIKDSFKEAFNELMIQ